VSDFSTEAAVEMVAEERALRQLRDDVEERLSDVQVGVSAGSAGGGGGGGRPPEMRSDGGQSSRERRRRRREFRWARQNNSNIEDILEAIRGLELTGGRGSGMLAEVFGVGGDLATEAAGTAADAATSLATEAAGSALGNAAGSIIADQINGSAVGLKSDTIAVTPNPLPVDGGGGGGATVSPEFQPTFKPTIQPTIDVSPELSVSPDVNVSPNIDFPDIDLGSNIQNPHPVTVTNMPSVIAMDTRSSAMTSTSTSTSSSSSNNGLGAALHEDLPLTQTRESVSVGLASLPSRILGNEPPDEVITPAGPINTGSDNSTSSENGSTTVQNHINNDVRPQFTINVEFDRLVDEVRRAIDDANDEVRRELIDKIEQVERDVEGLEQQITRGR